MNKNPQNGLKSLSIEKPVLSINMQYKRMLAVFSRHIIILKRRD